MDWRDVAHRGPFRLQLAGGVIIRTEDLDYAIEAAFQIECVSMMDANGVLWFEGDHRDPNCDRSGLRELVDRSEEYDRDIAVFESMLEERFAGWDPAFIGGKDFQ